MLYCPQLLVISTEQICTHLFNRRHLDIIYTKLVLQFEHPVDETQKCFHNLITSKILV